MVAGESPENPRNPWLSRRGMPWTNNPVGKDLEENGWKKDK
jgi:hypothetical protein